METGEIDLIHGVAGHGSGQISLDAFERFTTMPGYVTRISQPLASRVVAINSKRCPTADLAVRQAIQHAVNKAALVKAIFYGVEQQADTLYPTDIPYCDLNLKPYAFDPKLAEKILEEAGWRQEAPGAVRSKDGQELAIDLCFVGNDAQQKAIAEVIQGDLQEIGIKINNDRRGTGRQHEPPEDRRVRPGLQRDLGCPLRSAFVLQLDANPIPRRFSSPGRPLDEGRNRRKNQ